MARSVKSLTRDIIVVALILFCGFYFEKNRGINWKTDVIFTKKISGGEYVKFINITKKDKKDIFVAEKRGVKVFDLKGRLLFSRDFSAEADFIRTGLGDIDGDGKNEILVVGFSGGRKELFYKILNGRGNVVEERKFNYQSPYYLKPFRVLLYVKGRRHGVIISGLKSEIEFYPFFPKMSFLGMKIDPLREAYLTENKFSVNNISIATISGRDNIVASMEGGTISFLKLDSSLNVVSIKTTKAFGHGSSSKVLRKMRCYDVNFDGNDEAVIGNDKKIYPTILIVKLGNSIYTLFKKYMVKTKITEIRALELDGNPDTIELFFGTKKRGIYEFVFGKGNDRGVNLIGTNHIFCHGKIVELTTILDKETNKNYLLFGNRAGDIGVDYNGKVYTNSLRGSSLVRIDSKGDNFLILFSNILYFMKSSFKSPPFYFSFVFAAFILSIFYLILSSLIGKVKRPKMEFSAREETPEALKAERKMLLDSLYDLKKVFDAGEMDGEAYAERTKEIRERIKIVEEKLFEMGVKLEVEMYKCPNCGASVSIHEDRCPYCGSPLNFG